MRTPAVLGLLALLTLPATAATGDGLALLAEVPSSGGADDLSSRRLASEGRVFLVSVAAGAIETWPVGAVSEPLVSPGPGTAIRGRAVFGDFDGDGRLDLAVSVAGGVRAFAGDGAGLFRAATMIPAEGARQLAAGDVDGDGRFDLIVAADSPGGALLRTFRSLGGFRFDGPRDTPGLPAAVELGSFVAGDLDGDGRSDVIASGSSGFSAWISRGDGTFALAQAPETPGAVEDAVLSDLDRDGRPDLVLGLRFLRWTSVATFHNEGGGQFRAFPRQPSQGTGNGLLAVADLDGDGLPDIAGVSVTEAPCSRTQVVLQGDGHGGFGSPGLRPFPCVPELAEVSGLAAVDWDDDGTEELAVRTPRGPVVLGPSRPRYDDVLIVPVLVSTSGVGGVRFESDLLVTNSGVTPVRLDLRYVATAGGGSGAVAADLAAGAQLRAPSALGTLRAAGLPITDSGPAIGTLRIEVAGASALHAVRASVLTRSSGGGGVSSAASTRAAALRASAVVPWLTETERDRTNLALVNAGGSEDGPITLHVTVSSGDPAVPGLVELPDVVLPPGGFHQLNRVLLASGLPSRIGWARIRRVSGNAPYLAWATVNDAVTGDGSIVAAFPDDAASTGPLTFPAAVQGGRYTTELVLTNPREVGVQATVSLSGSGSFVQPLAPYETFYVEDLVAETRRRGLPGAPPAGAPFVGEVVVNGAVGGLRVSTTGEDGRFGVFEPPIGTEAKSVVLPDLRRDASTRTNLAVVNGYGFGGPHVFRLEIHDGDTPRLAASTEITLERGARLQLDDVLRSLAPSVVRGWARVVPSLPTYFSAYAVVMDGAVPGEGPDDGAFVPGVPEESATR